MANEKRTIFMDAAGNVLECSMCDPTYAAEWAELNGYDHWDDMDRPDEKAKYVEPGDKFIKASGTLTKGAGKAALDAFVKPAQPVKE